MKRFRPVLLVTLALLLAAALTFAFSPSARAAVQDIFSFNGVHVSIDEDTGKLVTSGNTDAIIEQGDNYVAIQGEDGSAAGVVVAGSLAGEQVTISELLSRYPDLTLPNVPAGYTLDDRAMIMEDGSLAVSWTNAAGYVINYSRNVNPPQTFEVSIGDGVPSDVPEGGFVITNTVPGGSDPSLGVGGGFITGTTGIVSGTGEIGSLTVAEPPLPAYNWQANGYYHYLFSNDPSLSEADLQTMVP